MGSIQSTQEISTRKHNTQENNSLLAKFKNLCGDSSKQEQWYHLNRQNLQKMMKNQKYNGSGQQIKLMNSFWEEEYDQINNNEIDATKKYLKKYQNEQLEFQCKYQLCKYNFYCHKYNLTEKSLEQIINSKYYASKLDKINQANIMLFRFFAFHYERIDKPSTLLENAQNYKQQYYKIFKQIQRNETLAKYQMLLFLNSLMNQFILLAQKIQKSNNNKLLNRNESKNLKRQLSFQEAPLIGSIFYLGITFKNENKQFFTPKNSNNLKQITRKFLNFEINFNVIVQKQDNHIKSKQLYYIQQNLFRNQLWQTNTPKKTEETQIYSIHQIQKKCSRLAVYFNHLYILKSIQNKSWIKMYKNLNFCLASKQQWNLIIKQPNVVQLTVIKQEKTQSKLFQKSVRPKIQSYTNILSAKRGNKNNQPKQNIQIKQSGFIQNQRQKVIQNISNKYPTKQERKYDFNRGLLNIGNTCYMNSALQCLHKSQFFTQGLTPAYQFTKTKYKQRTYRLTQQLITFIDQMWQDRQAFDPRELHSLIYKENHIFKLGKQNDAIEFLITLLSVLGRQLNDPLENKKVDIDFLKDDQQIIYQKTKKKNEMINKSFLQQIFGGRYRVEFECERCKRQQVRFQKFRVHYLQIPKPEKNQSYKFQYGSKYNQQRQTSQTLQKCLKNFKNPQLLSGDNALNCKKCNKQRPTNRVMQICEMNKIFVVCLKRFHNDTKNQRLISVPKQVCFENLTIQGKKCKRATYKLYAAILHSGHLNGGHYTAVCFNYLTQKWMKYNDERCYYQQRDNSRQINLDDAYALFYQVKPVSMQSQQHPNIKFVGEIDHVINNSPPKIIPKVQAVNYYDYMLSILQCFAKSSLCIELFQQNQFSDVFGKDSLINIFRECIVRSQKQGINQISCIQISSIIQNTNFSPSIDGKNYKRADKFIQLLLKYIQVEVDNKIQNNKHLGQSGYERKVKIRDQCYILKIIALFRQISISFNQTFECYKHKKKQTISFMSFVHSLQIIKQNKQKIITLQKCLAFFAQMNKIKMPIVNFCKNCDTQIKYKQIKIENTGRILIIKLNRFLQNKKINHSVNIPLKLDPKYIITKQQAHRYKNKYYQLFGVVSHEGDQQHGRITAQWLNFSNRTWQEWNKTCVQKFQTTSKYEIQRIQPIFPNAYILFYELKDQ